MFDVRIYHAPMLAFALLAACATPSNAQVERVLPGTEPSYAEVADNVLGASAIVDLSVTRAIMLRPDRAGPLPPGIGRMYIEADVNNLIRGRAGLAPQVRFLADVALDSRGKPPKLKKRRFFAFARGATGGELQLIRPDALLPWSPDSDLLIRSVTREAVAIDAPPAIGGVSSAFHVPGNLPGEGETQIFLATESGRPISISVLRRPGQERRWSVSLTEIVDEAAATPRRDTLLWYRLACGGLPAELPAQAISTADPVNAQAAREDYRFVRQSVGQCRAGTQAIR